MAGVEDSWKRPSSSAKLALWNEIKPRLVGKHSQKYSATSVHDFMHHKFLVAVDVVATGSFNLSRNATLNAENAIVIHDERIAAAYSAEVDALVARYGQGR